MDTKVQTLWDKFKQLENDLRKTMSYREVLQTKEHQEALRAWRQARNTCQSCGSENTIVKNYSPIWQEGDLVCVDCDTYVRSYDAG